MGTVIGQDRDTAVAEARFADVLDWVCVVEHKGYGQ